MKCPIPDCGSELKHQSNYICNSKHSIYDLVKEVLVGYSYAEVNQLLADELKEKLDLIRTRFILAYPHNYHDHILWKYIKNEGEE